MLTSRPGRTTSFLCVCCSLQKILGVTSLDEVLDHRCINPQNIIHNMTKVNKHGVVTLDETTSRFWSSRGLSLSVQLHVCLYLCVDAYFHLFVSMITEANTHAGYFWVDVCVL